MFESLTEKLGDVFRRLRGQALLTESNIADAMREARAALIDADVNVRVADEFIEKVSKECLGESVLKSVTPGQQVIKIINDKLTEFMGESESPLNLKGSPAVIIIAGLHGGGKTTTSAKLAAMLKKKGRKVLLAACDVYRPAAIDQLETLGAQTGVPVYADRDCPDVSMIGAAALDKAKRENFQVLILDTAGRLQIDQQMIMELARLNQIVQAEERILVADAALGQEAVSVASHFHSAIDLTGVILTKLDGDARGGAALSIRKVTGCPIKFVGVGEKIEDLEVFYPDRMASRILGMGDIVSLVEKAAEEIDQAEAAKLQEKFKQSSFDFNDFLSYLRQMGKMGGVESILKMLPGGADLASNPEFDPKQFRGMEAIICSMTKAERANPDIISFQRKKRIAAGSGCSMEDVARLIKQFDMMRKMMKRSGLISRLMGGGLPTMGAGMNPGFASRFSRGSNRIPPKKKRKKRR